MILTVCIGSGCHVKGSRRIVEILEELVNAENDPIFIELEACFCQGKCTEGVVVKFDSQVVTGVSAENIKEIYYQKRAEAIQ